ncbi:MAG: aminotransferase class V-fold PLP-dependent enzyme [Pseudomonadota bacterium]
MLSCQRDAFSIPDGVHYFNCASMAPLLRSAEAAGTAGLQRQRLPVAASPADYFAEPTRLRETIARLINCETSRIALTPAVSYGVAIAANNLELHAGQNVVVVEDEFPSDVYPWMRACEHAGATLRTVARAPDSTSWNTAVLEHIDANTALVCVSTVNWTDGLRFDVGRIGERCRAVGAVFVVDGTQSIGAAPFDFAQIQPDLLVCAGYKWLLGPYQMGFAAVGDRLLEGEPFELHWSTRAGSEDTSNTAYHPRFRAGARRFDVGEQNNPITVPMLTAGVQQVLDWSVASIAEYLAALATEIDAGLNPEHHVLVPERDRDAHILGIRLQQPEYIDTTIAALKRANVQVSKRGSIVRVAPHLHCDSGSVAALLQALEDAARA